MYTVQYPSVGEDNGGVRLFQSGAVMKECGEALVRRLGKLARESMTLHRSFGVAFEYSCPCTIAA
jgi:hypothetical protein